MIYFARLARGTIKIGCTENLKARLRSLASEHGEVLDLLATMPGSFAEEGAMHGRFNHLRLPDSNEYFFPSLEIYEAIGRPDLYRRPPVQDFEWFLESKNKAMHFSLRETEKALESLRYPRVWQNYPWQRLRRAHGIRTARQHLSYLRETMRPVYAMVRAECPEACPQVTLDMLLAYEDQRHDTAGELAGLLSRRRQDQGVKTGGER